MMSSAFARFRAVAMLMALTLACAAASAIRSAGAAELVMFDSKTCTICRTFNAEIGDDGYAAGKSAHIFPLRRIDLHSGTVDVKLRQPVTMTPTFIFVDNGAEIARFVGYPGRKYFFMLVDAAAEEFHNTSESGKKATGSKSAAAP